MSEQARLLLLQGRLDEIKKARRKWTVITFGVFLAIISLVTFYGYYYIDEFDFAAVFFILVLCVAAAGWFIRNYYEKQETAITWEIERIERARQ